MVGAPRHDWNRAVWEEKFPCWRGSSGGGECVFVAERCPQLSGAQAEGGRGRTGLGEVRTGRLGLSPGWMSPTPVSHTVWETMTALSLASDVGRLVDVCPCCPGG